MSLDPKAMSQTRLPVKGRKDLTSRAENATMPKFAYAWLSLMPSNFDEEIKSADNHDHHPGGNGKDPGLSAPHTPSSMVRSSRHLPAF
jgi:hypothetical protein